MSFLKGNIGESLWLDELSKTHTDIEKAPNKKFYDWDIKAKYKGSEVTYEVKYDSRGYYYADRYSRPVNLYIEFLNTKSFIGIILTFGTDGKKDIQICYVRS